MIANFSTKVDLLSLTWFTRSTHLDAKLTYPYYSITDTYKFFARNSFSRNVFKNSQQARNLKLKLPKEFTVQGSASWRNKS